MRLLLPLPKDRLVTRSAMLLTGLVAYGVSSGLILQANLGVDPWDVLHQGLARTLGGQVGPGRSSPASSSCSCGSRSAPALASAPWPTPSSWVFASTPPSGWSPPSITWPGRRSCSSPASSSTAWPPASTSGPARTGPRDGLTTAIAARGHQIRVVRTLIEVTVLAAGWLLGGSVGVGTVLYAALIGPITHRTIPLFTLKTKVPNGWRPPKSVAAAPPHRQRWRP